MTDLPGGAFVLVADAERALLLKNTGQADAPHLQVVRRESVEDGPPVGPAGPGEQGAEAAGGQRAALDDEDFHHFARDRLPLDLAQVLEDLARKGRFEAIVLVAPPQVLGALREHLGQEAGRRVIAEIPRTLTSHPIVEIEAALRDGTAGPAG